CEARRPVGSPRLGEGRVHDVRCLRTKDSSRGPCRRHIPGTQSVPLGEVVAKELAMNGGELARRLTAMVVAGLVYGVVLAGTGHTQKSDDTEAPNAEVARLY